MPYWRAKSFLCVFNPIFVCYIPVFLCRNVKKLLLFLKLRQKSYSMVNPLFVCSRNRPEKNAKSLGKLCLLYTYIDMSNIRCITNYSLLGNEFKHENRK